MADRRGDGSLDGNLVAPDGVQDGLGKGGPGRLDHSLARVLDIPIERHAGCIENPARGLGNLRAGPVSGNQGDLVGQIGTVLSLWTRKIASPASLADSVIANRALTRPDYAETAFERRWRVTGEA
jgi:hypothetical protein